jgi:8-oxo-dGTP pyrophosphatase MutT (NUDIX family)
VNRKAHLLTLLSDFEPEDEQERAWHEQIVALVEGDGDPFDRDRFDPGHVTASVFLTSAAGDLLYLIHHAKLDRWLQPGGHVEPGDADILAAAARELEEEVGVVAEIPARVFDVDVHEIPARKGDPAHLHHDVRFCVVLPEDQVPKPTDEVLGGRFFFLDEIPPDDESVRRAAIKLRDRAAQPS